MHVGSIIADARKRLDEAGGLEDVYFVACGGSLAAFWPCEYLLHQESTSRFRVSSWNAGQFLATAPRRLGRNSLVITCSHQGDTPETVKAAELAKSREATCIALTYTPDSPITKLGDHVIDYEWGPGSSVQNQKISMGLKLGFELLKSYEDYPHYGAAMAGFEAIHEITQSARALIAKRAKEAANEWRHEKTIYTLASGA